VILLCRVAWADGVIRDEERTLIHELALRFMPDLDPDEVDAWLDEGPPPAELQTLPDNLGQMFYYEAFRVMEADGELHDKELELLDGIMSTVFAGHPEDTPLLRIALRRR
jgi:uncharacterized tellurite resistance protein B-like protein